MTPDWSRADMPMMPKGRYRIMTAYMPKVGKLGLDMMYRTCTVQTNLDFSSEADMVKKLRVSLALQPVATALFANSPFLEGRPNCFKSFRSHVWLDTDNNRSGMLPSAFEEGMGYERYVDYALDVPMYFIYRNGHWGSEERQSRREAGPKEGLEATVRGRSARGIAREVVELARAGLDDGNAQGGKGRTEASFLDLLDQTVKRRLAPADDLLAL